MKNIKMPKLTAKFHYIFTLFIFLLLLRCLTTCKTRSKGQGRHGPQQRRACFVQMRNYAGYLRKGLYVCVYTTRFDTCVAQHTFSTCLNCGWLSVYIIWLPWITVYITNGKYEISVGFK